MSKIQTVIELLSDAKDKIAGLLNTPEDEFHRMKIISSMDKNIEYLSLMGGTNGQEKKPTVIHGPATTIGGKKITQLKSDLKEGDLLPEKTEIDILREKVDAGYPDFVKTETAAIMETMDHKVILGIAKKAKLAKVTVDTPISVEFIEQIKEAIKKKEK